MKQTIVASLFFAVIILAACNNSSSSKTKKDTAVATSVSDTSKMMASVKYTCKMHPEVISDTPGHCPKCGDEMVPIRDSSMNKMSMDTMKH
jgi:hypothetical protein